MRFAVLALVFFASTLQAAEPKQKQYQFKVRVCEGIAEEKEVTTIVSEPTIVSLDKRPFTLNAGSQVLLPKVPGQAQAVAEFGLGIHGKATALDEETVRLELQWHDAEVVTSNDDELEIKTVGLRLSKAVKLGEAHSFKLSKDGKKQTWVEMTITEVK